MTSIATDKSINSEAEYCKNMMPSIFMQCYPITNLDDLEEVIQEPPHWVNRVLPLALRSPTVLQNIISDCHSDAKHFLVRNRFDVRTVPKTLVCHDYRGGYLADKFMKLTRKLLVMVIHFTIGRKSIYLFTSVITLLQYHL